MAIYQNVKIFDYYEANRGAKSELAAQEVLDSLLQEEDIALVDGNTVVGYVREKRQIGRTIRATIWVSPKYLTETASENYRIGAYEIIRGVGGEMVCLHIEPINKPNFWDKIKFLMGKKKAKIGDSMPI